MKKIPGAIALCTILALTILALTGVAAAATGDSTLDVVKKRGKLIVGVRYDTPPGGYVDKNGEVVGFDVDIARYFAKKLGVELQLIQVTGKTRIAMLANGNVDLLAAWIAHTIERDAAIDFSITYFRGGSRFLVKTDSGIKGLEDLAGKTVAVVQGTPYGGNFLQKQPKGKVVTFQEYPHAVLALLQGKADAVFTAEEVLVGLAKGRSDLEVVGKVSDFPFWSGALGVRENDSKWRDWVNFTLIEMWKNKTIHALYRKYTGADPDPDFQMETWEL